jgi:hypothetical protein
MFEAVFHADWNTILLAIPFSGLLFISIFRLDEIFAAPKKKASNRRAIYGLDEEGEAMSCDPDGRTWSRVNRRRQPN